MAFAIPSKPDSVRISRTTSNALPSLSRVGIRCLLLVTFRHEQEEQRVPATSTTQVSMWKTTSTVSTAFHKRLSSSPNPTSRGPVRRTWAPKGETPVLIHAFNWKKISGSAAWAYRWDGSRSRLSFQLLAGSYDTESLIVFLKHLKRHFRGEKVILIWDGLPAHKSRVMREYLGSQARWLSVESLPGYAPDLNPVELLWGNVKGQELANRCVEDLSEMVDGIRGGGESSASVKTPRLLFPQTRWAPPFFCPGVTLLCESQ